MKKILLISLLTLFNNFILSEWVDISGTGNRSWEIFYEYEKNSCGVRCNLDVCRKFAQKQNRVFNNRVRCLKVEDGRIYEDMGPYYQCQCDLGDKLT